MKHALRLAAGGDEGKSRSDTRIGEWQPWCDPDRPPQVAQRVPALPGGPRLAAVEGVEDAVHARCCCVRERG